MSGRKEDLQRSQRKDAFQQVVWQFSFDVFLEEHGLEKQKGSIVNSAEVDFEQRKPHGTRREP